MRTFNYNDMPERGLFKKTARQKKRKKGPAEFYWVFCAVVCFMFGLASFLMFSAWDRFSGVAWGNVESDEIAFEEGFITADLSDSHREALLSFLSSDDPKTPDALEAPKLSEAPKPPAAAPLQAARQDVGRQDAPQKPGEAGASDEGVDAPPLPQVSTVASRPLPARRMMMEDFGPVPRYLSGYEDIVLSLHEDGTRLPEDSEELDGEYGDEEPDGIQLAEVGVGWKEHIVKAGETLSDIALAYGGLTAQDILRANGLKDANRLTANQLLLIPNDASRIDDTLDEVRTRQMRIAAIQEKVEPLKVSAYVVVQGDSLWSISNSQNIEVDTLRGSNAIKSSGALRPGEVLRIPNQDGIFYTLKPGEKVEAVCKLYGVNLNKFRQVNHGLDLLALKPGDELFLPGARIEAVVDTANEPKKLLAKENKEKGAPLEKEKGREKEKGKEKEKDKRAKNEKREKIEKTEKIVKAPNQKAPLEKDANRAYRWPVMGRINSPFGWRQHPITRRRDFHTGIDIKADRGTVIRSAREGQVVYSGWMGGYGKVLVVEHSNGQSTLYAHCSELLVGKGHGISRGQNIARVGTTGRATGPHLHFEVRSGNSPVNPLKYLK